MRLRGPPKSIFMHQDQNNKRTIITNNRILEIIQQTQPLLEYLARADVTWRIKSSVWDVAWRADTTVAAHKHDPSPVTNELFICVYVVCVCVCLTSVVRDSSGRASRRHPGCFLRDGSRLRKLRFCGRCPWPLREKYGCLFRLCFE